MIPKGLRLPMCAIPGMYIAVYIAKDKQLECEE